MTARFVGGSLHEKTRVVVHAARCYLAPVLPEFGSIEDFLNLGHTSEHKCERYVRTAYDHEHDVVTYTYQRTE